MSTKQVLFGCGLVVIAAGIYFSYTQSQYAQSNYEETTAVDTIASGVATVPATSKPSSKKAVITEAVAKDVFPQQLGSYQISSARKQEKGRKCETLGADPYNDTGLSGEICADLHTVEYRETGTGRGVYVIAYRFVSGEDLFSKYIHAKASPFTLGDATIRRLESHELLWWLNDESAFDLIFTQEFTTRPNDYGGETYAYGSATGGNPVTLYLIAEYPPRRD